ncbi:hypothetical protein [Streptomyces bullii]|uniref:Uncharacterized protein n=1 Tax=Streptomyces bullii TaxID=349910 RepID=A0ABW0V3B2_9ACTN
MLGTGEWPAWTTNWPSTAPACPDRTGTLGEWSTRPHTSNEAALIELLAYPTRDVNPTQ